MASFGYGVGDVVVVCQLLAKIAKVLRDSRRAESDYLQLVQELELLRALLSEVSQKPHRSHQPLIHRIAEGSRSHLENFLQKIQCQYESSLGGSSASGLRRLVVEAKQVKWAATQSDVTQLRTILSWTIQLIQLAIAEEISSTISDVNAMQSQFSHKLTSLDKASVRSETKVTALEQEQDQLRTQVMRGVGSIQDEQRRFSDVAMVEFEGLWGAVHGLSSNLITGMNAMQKSLDSMKLLMQQLLSLISDYPAKIYATLCKIFGITKYQVLRHLRLERLVCMNILLLLGKIYERLPTRVSGLLPSNVTFEDALGRIKSLSYDGFQHWEVFKTMLEYDFKGLPGHEKVIRGRYRILRSSDLLQIDEVHWQRFFLPGGSFQMSIILEKENRTKATRSLCPRCRSRGKFQRRCGAFSQYSCCDILYFDDMENPRPKRPQLLHSKPGVAESIVEDESEQRNESDNSNIPLQVNHDRQEQLKRQLMEQRAKEHRERIQEREDLYSFKRVHFSVDRGEQYITKYTISGDVEDVRLVEMALAGDLQGILHCFDAGANINAFVGLDTETVNNSGLETYTGDSSIFLSPLQAASSRFATFLLLVDLGADTDVQGGEYGSTLQAAACNASEEIVRYLVENGADVNVRGGYHGNALQGAAYTGTNQIVRYLVEKGANVNARGGEYGSALQAAAFEGNGKIMRYLVEKGANVNAQGGYHGNALQRASYTGKKEIVSYLVEKGANVNIRGGEMDDTALQIAASKGSEDIVRYLVEKGANVNAEGGFCGSALQAAVYSSNQDVVRYLVEKGADVRAHGGYYGNALQAAARQGSEETVRYLVEKGADVNAQGGKYGNSLEAAAYGGKEEVFRYLVEQGADVDSSGSEHRRARWAAAARGLKRS